MRPHARIRLYCFPSAGGSADTFRSWTLHLPSDIDVCPVHLPGRGRRFREPAHTRIEPLVAALCDELRPSLDRPFAFFGHSMGALVAFELARLLRGEQRRPVHLFVSGRGAPQCGADEEVLHTLPDEEVLHRLPDDRLIAKLIELEGTREEVLRNPQIMAVLLPAIRADLAACEHYRYRTGPRLECAISAMTGTHDVHVRKEDVAAWHEQTRAAFSLRVFPGGHFFLDQSQPDVLRAIEQDLLQPAGAAEEHTQPAFDLTNEN